jgi:hypothetical protein
MTNGETENGQYKLISFMGVRGLVSGKDKTGVRRHRSEDKWTFL